MKIWLRLLVLLFPFAAAAQPPVDRAVAITFDDLPFASVPAENSAQLQGMTDSSEPLEGVKVYLDGTPLPPVYSDASGNYTISDVPWGDYQINATVGGCKEYFKQDITVNDDLTLDITLATRYDTYGYHCRAIPFDWVEGTEVLPLYSNWNSTQVDLPFYFGLYGELYPRAYAATAGFLNFETWNGMQYNSPIPSGETPNAALYPFWDDLYVEPYYNDQVKVATLGVAPDRVWVLELAVESSSNSL